MTLHKNDQPLEEIILEMTTLKNGLKFIYERESEVYERVIELNEEIFYRTRKIIYLIDICRLEKRMLGITPRSKKISKQAFKFKPCEKTLHFYLESHLTNKNAEDGLKLLDESFHIENDRNLNAIRDLYYGSLLGVKGDYLNYNKLICRAKNNYIPGIYYQLKNFVSDYDLGVDDDLFLGRVFNANFGSLNVDMDFVCSISCDMKYFLLYADIFLSSFFYFNKNAVVHISIVNCENTSIVKDFLHKFGDKVLVSYFYCPDNIDYRPISATLRLLAAYELINKFKKPVLFCEIDGLVTADFSNIINLGKFGTAQLVRVIGSYLPWQRFTCGLGVFMPTPSGIKAAKLLNRYVKGIFNRTEKHWWADQCALEAAIRYSLLVDSEYDFKAIPMEFLAGVFFTPTGSDSHDKKVFLLNKKRSEIFDK
ncbi:hypothetical protein [Comamonas kerstersii]|uniref:hypothetical protein n=1 Tax=Comamonas kerstersii TaxID=225992 RepID=UPI001062C67F|nr:hypothetical protein [Comamonas kerstersii]